MAQVLHKSTYISELGKSNLSLYKYKGSDHSLISPFLQPFWNFTVELLPEWMAPNLVTLIGFVALILCYSLTLYHCPEVQGEMPQWIYIANIALLFWYQTLDAIDGKQARRTKSSSPLGELFDHGCDAIGSMLQTMTVACVIQLGPTWWTFVLLVIINFMFFVSIWEQYYTHVLHFHVLAGPTEGEFVAMIINLLTLLFGNELWNSNLFISLFPDNQFVQQYLVTMPLIGDPYQVKYLFVLGTFVTTAPALYSSIRSVYSALSTVQVPEHDEQVIEKRNMEARYHNLPPAHSMFIFLSFVLMFAVYLYFSPQDAMHTMTLLVCSTFGIVAAYLVSRMVLARVCDEQPPTFYMIIVPVPFMMIYSLSHAITRSSLFMVQESLIMTCYLIYVLAFYFHFIYDIMTNISAHLGIYCFSLGKRSTDKSEINSLLEQVITDEKQN